MKRWFYGILAAATSLFLLGSPAAAVNVNNFEISSYQVEMTLGRDEAGRSTLRTTETITAEFPQFDQNRGLERAIPKRYDGHPVALDVTSVSRPDGSAWNYTILDSGDNRVIRIGDADTYVRGTQTYVISYEQRDVTRYFENTKRDEWYWDINGTDWKVPIRQLAVLVKIDDSLKQAMTGNTACYQGIEGSTDRCELTETAEGFTATAANLGPGENMTLAIGFNAATFAPYEKTLFEKAVIAWAIVQAATVPVASGLFVWIVTRFVRTTSRSRELGTIVPEYVPPREASVMVSSKIAKQVRGSALAAQLVDLAVRHYIVLSEQEKKGIFGSTKRYSLEVLKALDDLRPEEREVLEDMFGHLPQVGEVLDLQTLQNNTPYYHRTTDNDKKLNALILEQYELKYRNTKLRSWLRKVGGMIGLAGLMTISPLLLILALVVFLMSLGAKSLTDKGLALRRYLAGLRDYIAVGEAERLRMLQSPEGAQKVATSSSDPSDIKQRIALYERVLPYAILFGQEKEWSKQLGAYYEQTAQQPDWYVGNTAFNAAVFSSALSGFSAASSNYGGASSSSSGGSSGGGSSGGGGGGGGGGGW